MTYEQALERAAAKYLRETLAASDWNVTLAAIFAGVNRTHMYELIARHRIERPPESVHRRHGDWWERGNREWQELRA